jgi:hypothetical protein
LRANASRLSHAELDAATELDSGDPHELGDDYARLKASLPALNVIGGCCGTDHRHIAAMAAAVVGNGSLRCSTSGIHALVGPPRLAGACRVSGSVRVEPLAAKR